MDKPLYYDIVKKIRGGLVLKLPAYDSSVMDRRIDFKYNVEKIRVPRVFALGIFTNGTLTNMYKKGYFTVEPANEFKQDCEGWYDVENETEDKIYTEKEILAFLKSGNRVEVKNILSENPVNRENIIKIAIENIDSLQNSMINDLERILGVSLIVETEEDAE